MKAGDLTQFVSVQQRSTSADALGGQAVTWTTLKQIWAGIRPLYGREYESARARVTEVSHAIVAHYDPALWADPVLAVSYRILYGSRVFNLHAILNDGERNESVTIYASEGLNNG